MNSVCSNELITDSHYPVGSNGYFTVTTFITPEWIDTLEVAQCWVVDCYGLWWSLTIRVIGVTISDFIVGKALSVLFELSGMQGSMLRMGFIVIFITSKMIVDTWVSLWCLIFPFLIGTIILILLKDVPHVSISSWHLRSLREFMTCSWVVTWLLWDFWSRWYSSGPLRSKVGI